MGTVEWFQQVCSARSSEEAFALLLSKPSLLWAERWPEVQRWIATQDADAQPLLHARLEAIQKTATAIERNPGSFPRDAGPIERLTQSVLSGELSIEMATAESSASAEALSPLYVGVFSDRVSHDAYDGKWREAVQACKLLLAAVDALPPGPGVDEMRESATVGWIQVVSAACNAVPDGRLFADALRRGEALILHGPHR